MPDRDDRFFDKKCKNAKKFCFSPPYQAANSILRRRIFVDHLALLRDGEDLRPVLETLGLELHMSICPTHISSTTDPNLLHANLNY